jgi:N-acetylneuraminic acid mutarotase
MAGVVYEGAIYIIGGETSQGVTGATLRYRASPGGWETLAGKPTAVTDVQAAAVGERIYVPGGKNTAGQPVNVLEVYSPRLNKWEQLAPLPVALSGYALAASEGRLYLFGGWDGSAVSAAVFSYDPATNTWKTGTPLPAPRTNAAAVLVENRIYVIGGYDGQQALRSVLLYFPDRDRGGDLPWEDRAPLPEGRYGMGATHLVNYIYLVGGLSEPKKTVEMPAVSYSTLNDRWNTFETPPTGVGLRPAVLAFDTRIYVLGGQDSQGLLSGHQAYQAIYTINVPSIQQ